jgi:6-phosphogluconolactonase (cycloisomerase 2 family)
MKRLLRTGFWLTIGLSIVAACGGGNNVTPGPIGAVSRPHAKPTATASATPAGPKIYAIGGVKRGAAVFTYPLGANGSPPPISTITGRSTGLTDPYGLTVDSAGKLYVVNIDGPASVATYAAGANGDATPIATITGTNTRLVHPTDVKLDPTGKVYVSNAGTGSIPPSITIYAAGANGNATPIDTITGTYTGLNGPWALALDAAGNIYVANDFNSTVTVYAAGANGNAAPIATISGPYTGLNGPEGVALDAAGNIYVSNDNAPYPVSITTYAAGANGNVAPSATIIGGNTGLSGPSYVALDSAGKIYVGDSDKILVFAAGASGNVAPTATITGSLGSVRLGLAIH